MYQDQALEIVRQIKELIEPYARYRNKPITTGSWFASSPKFEGILLVSEAESSIYINYLTLNVSHDPEDLIYMRFIKPLKLNQPILDYIQENHLHQAVEYL